MGAGPGKLDRAAALAAIAGLQELYPRYQHMRMQKLFRDLRVSGKSSLAVPNLSSRNPWRRLAHGVHRRAALGTGGAVPIIEAVQQERSAYLEAKQNDNAMRRSKRKR